MLSLTYPSFFYYFYPKHLYSIRHHVKIHCFSRPRHHQLQSYCFGIEGKIKAQAQKEFRQIYPSPGLVEHDAMEIWQVQLEVLRKVVSQCGGRKNIAAIGITNQRETTVVWNKKTGIPIHNALVWQDRRTSGYCDELKKQGKENLIRQKTGLVCDAYFSATKLQWLLDHYPNSMTEAESGNLAFGTMDSWLIYKLTGGALHATDVSNASRTMLFNIHTQAWDKELLDIFSVPATMLPDVFPSSDIYGYTAIPGLEGIAIAGVAGDQQAALFGQQCTEEGMIKNTYGTGCFIMMNTGTKAILSENNMLSTIAWKYQGETTYAMEGSIFIAGALVQWLRDGLGIIKKSADIEKLALSVSDNGGVYIVPAFTGLGAPHWDPYARGIIAGLTRGVNTAHIARASLEAICLQSYDVIRAMQHDAGIEIKEMRADGGASANNLLMQIQADILRIPIVRPAIQETTALGAAFLAGLAVSFWNSTEEIKKIWKQDTVFLPKQSQDIQQTVLHGWHKALEKAKQWEEPT